MRGLLVLVAILAASATVACVAIPKEVRATFAEAEEHENDYVRTRSDAPSPRGFLNAAEIAQATGDAGPTTTTTATTTPTSIDGGP